MNTVASLPAKLLACPFCGETPNIGTWKHAVARHPGATAIECSGDLFDCPVNPTATGYTQEEAIAAWNRRALATPAVEGGLPELHEPTPTILLNMLREMREEYGRDPNRFTVEHSALDWAIRRLATPEQPGSAAQGEDWIPVSERLPADGELVMVYTPDSGDGERFDFDFVDDGAWVEHSNQREHFLMVGGPAAAGPDVVCTGPTEEAPYTHWKPVRAPGATPPPAPSQGSAGEGDGWHGPGHSRLGDPCPVCPQYLNPPPKLIARPIPGQPGLSRLHCDRCGAGSYGLHTDTTPPPAPAAEQGDALAEQPEGKGAGTLLREALQYVGQRTDGGLCTLAERCELWMRESKDLLAAAPAAPVGVDEVWPVIDRLLGQAYGAGLNDEAFDMLAAKAKVTAALAGKAQEGK